MIGPMLTVARLPAQGGQRRAFETQAWTSQALETMTIPQGNHLSGAAQLYTLRVYLHGATISGPSSRFDPPPFDFLVSGRTKPRTDCHNKERIRTKLVG
jgi:hypothetical protein